VRAVTRRLHEVTRVRGDRRAHQLVVTSQCTLHRIRVLLPQARRTLDVGEKERDRPRRQLAHPTPWMPSREMPVNQT